MARKKKRDPRPAKLELTIPLSVRKAYHEAAHAVFALEFGMLRPEGLKLKAPEGLNVTTQDENEHKTFLQHAGGAAAISLGEPKTAGKAELHQDIVTLLAATVAEMFLLQQSGKRTSAIDMLNLHVHAWSDILRAVIRIENLVDDERVIPEYRDLFHRTLLEVHKRWPAIEAVATHALARGHLTRDEIEELVRASVPTTRS